MGTWLTNLTSFDGNSHRSLKHVPCTACLADVCTCGSFCCVIICYNRRESRPF